MTESDVQLIAQAIREVLKEYENLPDKDEEEIVIKILKRLVKIKIKKETNIDVSG